MSEYSYAISLLVFLVVMVVVSARSSAARGQLPPGPGGLPLLGSVHKMPLKYQERQLYEWRKQYGDVIYLKLFRTPVVVLNTLQAATDVLTKRSAKHSDRPRMVLLAELMNQASSIPAMPYGERFRKHRKWMHEAVGTKERLNAYRSIQLREVHNLLKNLLSSPERFIQHCHLYVAAIMLEIAYGKRVDSLEDELVAVADRALEGINRAGTPGAMIVDFFPSLKMLPTWLPGAGFKRRALEVGVFVQTWKDTGYNIVKTALTRGALIAFMLAMTRNPDVLREAQEEIDKVVGNDRLPDFGDCGSLPYLDAMVEELYRLKAIPHRSTAEDEYLGYTIPAGSLVMPNIWGITRDPTIYPDPEEFRPERFIRRAGKDAGKGDIPLPSTYVFGFGRRICPGQELANPSLWLAMAQIIAAFDIRKPLDADGNEITPPAVFRSGFTR
ncbi:hypothetical protein BN946_scf184868.g15 [Trametes cinnabarina]|uniref:Cytochrome P450 n=1 Tax=Pycnoporus cinnabarinus TaxID=5643 RepID=A0A060SR01_PYCCI|nr:hypothetical protein BN946_scf184868.g15 [Trametes cinnabarina]